MFQNDLGYATGLTNIRNYLDNIDDRPQAMNQTHQSSQPHLNTPLDEFDPAIKFGRDNKLFIKRNYMERLTQETRFTEEELRILKDLYVTVSELGKGLDLDRFKEFIARLYNIENHVMAKRLFFYFDLNEDGIVEFFEIARALDIIEKGDFEEKVEFCYCIYEPDELGYLDSYAMRELLKTSYTEILAKLEKCIKIIKKFESEGKIGLTWEELANPKNGIIDLMKESIPTIIDRYDYKRALVEELEKKEDFNIDKLKQFWDVYYVTSLSRGESYAREYYTNSTNIKRPENIVRNQFKLVMHDLFKVRNEQLLDDIYSVVDKNQKQYVEAAEVVNELIFSFKENFLYKFSMFFEINAVAEGKIKVLPKVLLCGFLDELYGFYYELHESAKEIVNHMKVSKDGKIYPQDFRNFCVKFPSAMDFIARLTLGEHPQPLQLDQEVAEYTNTENSLPSIGYGVNNSFQGDHRALVVYQSQNNIEKNNYKEMFPTKRWMPRSLLE